MDLKSEVYFDIITFYALFDDDVTSYSSAKNWHEMLRVRLSPWCSQTFTVAFLEFCRGVHKHLPQVRKFLLSRLPYPIFVHLKTIVVF